LPAKVEEFRVVNNDVLIMTLRLPPTSSFVFLPGQYIDLNWRDRKRSYSIASSQIHEKKIELHIKKVDGGSFSDSLFSELKNDQLFRFYGPLGTFFLREGAGPVIFLCTGTGFAPVKSMVESLIESGSERSIFIYWGCRFLDSIYSELPFLWAEQHSNIKFIPVLSREENTESSFEFGYVQQAVIKLHNDLHKFEVYGCGSEKMIHDAKKLLTFNGLNEDNFYSDAFVPSN
jgi:CDP-4-dehydro-6-deoxyglucose reductase